MVAPLACFFLALFATDGQDVDLELIGDIVRFIFTIVPFFPQTRALMTIVSVSKLKESFFSVRPEKKQMSQKEK